MASSKLHNIRDLEFRCNCPDMPCRLYESVAAPCRHRASLGRSYNSTQPASLGF